MSFDVWLENRTPFVADTHVQLDADGQEVLVVMVSASFVDADLNGQLQVAGTQVPVVFGDEPYGDPALSSTRYEADIVPVKPLSEIIVNGSAHAPDGQPARVVQVGLQAGDIRKILTVTGDRAQLGGGWSDPTPFRVMPLRWERTFGGSLEDGTCDQRNPVGIGFEGARSADRTVVTEAPNVAYAAEGDAPTTPAGFGTVGRGWLPRLPLAGTYDDAWLERQWPLPPHDFDPRYNLCAPRDQQSEQLRPGSEVTLINMTPTGRWRFRIPRLTAPLRLIYDDRIVDHELRPDTILVEPDDRRVTLKARHSVTIVRNQAKLREVVLGHVSPVWLNARRKRKDYVNPLGGDGTLTEMPVWTP